MKVLQGIFSTWLCKKLTGIISQFLNEELIPANCCKWETGCESKRYVYQNMYASAIKQLYKAISDSGE